MARKPAVELAKEWFSHAEDADSDGMASLLADDALFYAQTIRGRRFKGRDAIRDFLAEAGFEATGYAYTAVDDEYAVVTLSLRRRLARGGLADSTLAMVFKAEGDEIVCMDAFPSASEAFASLSER
jgi:hypothetical protein